MAILAREWTSTHLVLQPRRGGRTLDVAARERQERRPVRAPRVPPAMLAEGQLAVDERRFDRGELGGSQVLLAEQPEHRRGGDRGQETASLVHPLPFGAGPLGGAV